MEPVSVFLLVIAAVFLVGIAGEWVFEKTGVPDVVWLIAMGIVIGPVLELVERGELLAAAPHVGALALVVVLFDSGSELELDELGSTAGRSIVLAGVGFLFAVGAVAPTVMIGKWVGVVPPSWGWMHAIMIGAILGGSSSVVIMPALRRVRFHERYATMVNLESALTAVLSVVSTGAILAIMAHRAEAAAGIDPGSAAMRLVRSFAVGTVLGCVAGLVFALALRRLRNSDFAYPLILSGLLVLYVVVGELGGSGALGILAAAVMIGNAPSLAKTSGLARSSRLGKSLSGVHDPISFLIKSFFFTFVGAMLGPPWEGLLFGLCLGLVLLAARLPGAAIATFGAGMSQPTRVLFGVLFPRGMAAGALAILPLQLDLPDAERLPGIVFATITATVAVFAVLFPIVRRRLPPSDLDGPTVDFSSGDPSVSGWSVTEMETVSVEPDESFSDEPPTRKRKKLRRDKKGLAAPADEGDVATRAVRSPPPPPDPVAPTQRPPARGGTEAPSTEETADTAFPLRPSDPNDPPKEDRDE